MNGRCLSQHLLIAIDIHNYYYPVKLIFSAVR